VLLTQKCSEQRSEVRSAAPSVFNKCNFGGYFRHGHSPKCTPKLRSGGVDEETKAVLLTQKCSEQRSEVRSAAPGVFTKCTFGGYFRHGHSPECTPELRSGGFDEETKAVLLTQKCSEQRSEVLYCHAWYFQQVQLWWVLQAWTLAKMYPGTPFRGV